MAVVAKTQLGGVQVSHGPSQPRRMANLIWGSAGCGKTTFAATAPGDKLWLSFGDNEHASVSHRKDVYVADYSGLAPAELFKHAQSDNPFGLDAYLAEQEHIETVVCDSATAISALALDHVVERGVGGGKGFVPTIEAPGLGAYGGRNAVMLKVLKGLLRVTAKHNVHLIITAHEDDPSVLVQDGKEIISHITIMLGGKLVNNVSWRLSEVWYMSIDRYDKQERKLAIRPTRLRRPMKSRMFSNKGDPEFVLQYDADLPDEAKGQMTIAKWYDQWAEGNWAKIQAPEGPRRK